MTFTNNKGNRDVALQKEAENTMTGACKKQESFKEKGN